MTLDPWLLERLVCPATRTPLRWDEEARELVSDAAGLAYPVRNGVPVLLVEAGRVLTAPLPLASLRSTAARAPACVGWAGGTPDLKGGRGGAVPSGVVRVVFPPLTPSASGRGTDYSTNRLKSVFRAMPASWAST